MNSRIQTTLLAKHIFLGNLIKFSGNQGKHAGKKIFKSHTQLSARKWFEQNFVRSIKGGRGHEVFPPRTSDKKDFYRANAIQRTGEEHSIFCIFLMKIEHGKIGQMLGAKPKCLLLVGGRNHATIEVAEYPSDVFRDDWFVFEQEDGRYFHPTKIGGALRTQGIYSGGIGRYSGKPIIFSGNKNHVPILKFSNRMSVE